MKQSKLINKYTVFRLAMEFSVMIIMWHFIQYLYPTRKTPDLVPLHLVEQIDYNISMENLAKLRSSMYPSTKTPDLVPLYLVGQIDYNISMENLAKLRSSRFPSTTVYNWLFVSSSRTYRIMMDRNYFAQYYAAKRHPNVNAILWGPGFAGYNSSMTIKANIQHRFDSANYFHVIYISGDHDAGEIRSVSHYSPIMLREHECWGYRCVSSILNNNVSIFLETYAYEIELYYKSFSYNRVIAHSPLNAEPLIFYPPLVLNTDIPPVRDIDILVVGARSSFVYPIRTRLADMINKGLIKNGHVHDHPGYMLSDNSVKQTENQTRIYAALLRRAKIVIVDSSRYSYALSKYSEVPLSGCLVLGDIPAEREDEFRSFIVQISMDMTDNEIISIIDYWITHDKERETRAALGQKLVLNSYTYDHSIDITLQAIINYRRGQFGVFYKYPYTMKCVPLDNSGRKGSVSKWCDAPVKGTPFSVLCECNRTGIDYFDDVLDLDNWKAKGCDVNATNPRMYQVPTSMLRVCNSHEVISRMVHAAPLGSYCYCPTLPKEWGGTDTCFVENSDLTISRHLACQ